MTTRVRVAGLLLVVLMLLAGCSSGDPATSSATTTEIAANGSLSDAEELRSETLTAMGNVSAYSAVQNATTIERIDGQNRTVILGVEYAVNRTTRSLVAHRSETRGNERIDVDRYVIEQTLYQRSEQFREEYGSEWIERDVSEGFATQWHLYDQLWRYQFILGNASISSAGTDTVDGTAVQVLEADVDTTELNTALREALNLPPGSDAGVAANTTIQATFWIDTETHRPLKVQRTVTGPRTVDGESIQFERELTTTLTYRNVSVSLPDGAGDAVLVGTE